MTKRVIITIAAMSLLPRLALATTECSGTVLQPIWSGDCGALACPVTMVYAGEPGLGWWIEWTFRRNMIDTSAGFGKGFENRNAASLDGITMRVEGLSGDSLRVALLVPVDSTSTTEGSTWSSRRQELHGVLQATVKCMAANAALERDLDHRLAVHWLDIDMSSSPEFAEFGGVIPVAEPPPQPSN